jgi:hypothetical protein
MLVRSLAPFLLAEGATGARISVSASRSASSEIVDRMIAAFG